MSTVMKDSRRQWHLPFRVGAHRGLLVALIVLGVVFAALDLRLAQPFGYGDLSSTASSTASLALASIGETIVIIGGGLDLSTGAVLSLSNCLFVTHAGSTAGSLVLWALIAIAAGGLVGAVNGFFVAYMRLQPVVVTLATMFMTQGITLLIMKQPGGTVAQEFTSALSGDAFGGNVPMPLVVIVVGLLVWTVIKQTRFGTAVYAVGSDESAAHLKSLSTRSIKFWFYVIAGCFYGAAGVFFSAQTGGGDPLAGAGMLLPIFVAVVLGGTPLGGGRGGCLGTVVGAFSVTLIANMLLVLNVSTYYSTIVEGFILILAVLGSSNLGDISRIVLLPRRSNRPKRVSKDADAQRSTRYSSAEPAMLTLQQRLRYSMETMRICLPSFAGLAVLVVLTLIMNPGIDVGGYLQSMLVLASFLAVLALGQGAVVLSGGLDLSVPFTITLAGVVLTGVTNGSDIAGIWAVPAVLVLGAMIGALNGVGVSVLRISPLIMTLAMNGILQGAALVYTDGAPTGFAPPAIRWLMTGRFLGVPPVLFGLAIFVGLAYFLVHSTVYGRRLFAVGSNPISSKFSGVPVTKVLVTTYALSGLCSALVGVMLSGFTGQAFNDMGDPYLLTSIAVVVVGGTLMTGGRGNYAGMFGGALMLTALATLLSGSTLPPAARSIVYGAVVLAAVVAMREKRPA
ncbi:ABC transporter permease [Caballeronia novacaledonica]|uniref:ABC transporter permease n=1 Tax=Caballeronia novacaledonica TaxID=1544861 RepID=A0AA37ID17_9BURK|nr:ABC transporter permease [Caballeronia novacaledonica]GJH27004.1 ABC transporter permease [Caballeronia novacaledonica]